MAVAIVATIGWALAWPAVGGELRLGGLPGFGGVTLRSMREGRYRDVIKQQYDFSCGSAALATLLTYHYGRPSTEEEVFRSMWQKGDQERISEVGFSLLDMKAYLASQGLSGDGFRVPLDKLAAAGIPAITLINTGGYEHFVVIKGITESEVLIGDPALGARALSRADFEAIWQGILFVLRSEGEVGRDNFNQTDAWQLQAPSRPDAVRHRQGLASFTRNLPQIGEF